LLNDTFAPVVQIYKWRVHLGVFIKSNAATYLFRIFSNLPGISSLGNLNNDATEL